MSLHDFEAEAIATDRPHDLPLSAAAEPWDRDLYELLAEYQKAADAVLGFARAFDWGFTETPDPDANAAFGKYATTREALQQAVRLRLVKP